MSWRATKWALGVETGSSIAKIVLLVLAGHASRHDNTAWPSQETIAKEAEITVTSVKNGIQILKTSG
jgi:hypothetical protein